MPISYSYMICVSGLLDMKWVVYGRARGRSLSGLPYAIPTSVVSGKPRALLCNWLV